jgi:hypothetical protein
LVSGITSYKPYEEEFALRGSTDAGLVLDIPIVVTIFVCSDSSYFDSESQECIEIE